MTMPFWVAAGVGGRRSGAAATVKLTVAVCTALEVMTRYSAE